MMNSLLATPIATLRLNDRVLYQDDENEVFTVFNELIGQTLYPGSSHGEKMAELAMRFGVDIWCGELVLQMVSGESLRHTFASRGYVITHPETGMFVGMVDNNPQWSRSIGGQIEAIQGFYDYRAARRFAEETLGLLSEQFELREVELDEKGEATLFNCWKEGLDLWEAGVSSPAANLWPAHTLD